VVVLSVEVQQELNAHLKKKITVTKGSKSSSAQKTSRKAPQISQPFSAMLELLFDILANVELLRRRRDTEFLVSGETTLVPRQ
jgi:hypothetical protein